MQLRRSVLVLVPSLLMVACAAQPVGTPAAALPPPPKAVAYEASLTGL